VEIVRDKLIYLGKEFNVEDWNQVEGEFIKFESPTMESENQLEALD